MTDTSVPFSAEFHLNTSKLSEDDACLEWLKERYSRTGTVHQEQQKMKNNNNNSNEGEDLFLINLENDVAACATHRWAHFSQQSPLYGASSQALHSRKVSGTELRIEKNTAEVESGKYNVSLQDSNNIGNKNEYPSLLQTEPSRHIFTEALRKRNHQILTEKIEAAAARTTTAAGEDKKLSRPFFGGYISSPVMAGPTRFLLFPQWMHDTALGEKKMQEVPYFLRGSIKRNKLDFGKCNLEKKTDKGRRSLQQLFQEIIFNASFSRKFSISIPRWHFFQNIDAIRTDLYFNNRNSEQSYFGNQNKTTTPITTTTTVKGTSENEENISSNKAEKIITVGFRDAGVRTSLFSHNPRHSIMLDSAYRVSTNLSNSPESEQAVASLVVTKGFDSAVQRFTNKLLRHIFPNGRYHLQFSAGSGVEYVTDDTPWTLFGKLATEWWVDLPIHKRLLFRIRNQSALVHPFTKPLRNTLPTSVLDENDEEVMRDDELINENSGSSSVTNDALIPVAATTTADTHSLFWATQGPRWDSNLVRGFRDDHPSMHYASRWYTLVSAELSISRNKNGKNNTTGSWNMPSGLLYANACLTDSFAHPPRASVGFSFTGAPRRTIDAFNALTSTTFECSFNWWLHFGKEQVSLVSGLSTGQRAEDSILRLSPSETFKHLRCGLTWRI
ncbi:uncharacterized protein TM35_000411730 [Trypanosoma theileri]|uniref:Uncharacterized protein n=1 Tax=Trypanosoma theileri TaxID=67003 RepID=A0A1X0NK18_9TRYP|nr:uncharacterized protein TM35_000411730 [Trypanosoma theileri]ORC84803.1 hypothetical protein TM35_000411730 [Trypanosoma theileri]